MKDSDLIVSRTPRKRLKVSFDYCWELRFVAENDVLVPYA